MGREYIERQQQKQEYSQRLAEIKKSPEFKRYLASKNLKKKSHYEKS